MARRYCIYRTHDECSGFNKISYMRDQRGKNIFFTMSYFGKKRGEGAEGLDRGELFAAQLFVL